MAVNKVVYNTANGAETLLDLTGDTVTPETLAEGKTAHDKSGNIINGTLRTIPKASKIKYIIPATFTPPRTSDNLGFDAISFTFTRENVNQLFNVDWMLQDATDFTTDGYWVQHINWIMHYQGNYNSQHLLFYTWSAAGKRGYIVPTSKLNNMAKTSLSQTFSVGSNTTTDPLYARNGQNYKGLILIYDSTYDGPPIVDETKLSQFFTCDYITAGM